jgi:hypothetical protein
MEASTKYHDEDDGTAADIQDSDDGEVSVINNPHSLMLSQS